MDIDFSGARGQYSFSSKGKPGHDGEAGVLKITVRLAVTLKPDFVDKYLDGHLSGAQPSAVLWREMDPGKPDTAVYPRYMGLKRVHLEVSQDRQYAFKLRNLPPAGWTGKPTEFPGYREVTLLPVDMKSVSFAPATNGLLANLTFVAENQRPELSSLLSELVVLDEVAVDGWLVDRDLDLGDSARKGDDRDDEEDDRDDDEEENQGDALARAMGIPDGNPADEEAPE